MSAYGENAAPIELPHPTEMARKMSSPTLDQYHVSSRSPEQQRRQSILPTNDQSLTLAPIKSLDVASERRHETPPVGHDNSQIVQDGTTHPPNADVAKSISFLAHHREPAYTREEPITSQIRRPSDSSQIAPERRLSVSSINADLKAPIANLKQEHSSHARSPLRESSVPVPSTEMPTASTIPRKRPPPKSAGKKGTASTIKKEPAAKRRKMDAVAAAAKRGGTPSSQKSRASLVANKRITSTSATSANSSPAPRSVRTNSPRSSPTAEVDGDAESQDEDEEEDQGTPDPDADLYCLCKRPDTGTFMIGCDGECNDWFHGKCVGIAEKDKGLIDKYICPTCEKPGQLFTTWKRMCRRAGCRMPAKGAGDPTKKGKPIEKSKYCSDECGVRYFETLSSKTREGPPSQKTKSKKHRGSVSGPDATNSFDEDLGPRGGLLHTGELKKLIGSASGVDKVKSVGDGVLSPPLTPSPKATRDSPEMHKQAITLNEVEQVRVAEITKKKDITRTRHGLLRDRQMFVPMVKQAATRLAEEKKLKTKEMCGFDSRVAWTEEQFGVWRASPEGAAALKTGVLRKQPAVDGEGDTGMTNGVGEGDDTHPALCTRRKCARHHEWAKLALDDLRMEVTENSEAMRVLEREEREIKERAGLRARERGARGSGGSVELHGAPKATIPELMVAVEENGKNEVVADVSGSVLKAEEQESESKEQSQTLATPAIEVGGGGLEP